MRLSRRTRHDGWGDRPAVTRGKKGGTPVDGLQPAPARKGAGLPESSVEASTIAVQLIPADAMRRVDAADPGTCPFWRGRTDPTPLGEIPVAHRARASRARRHGCKLWRVVLVWGRFIPSWPLFNKSARNWWPNHTQWRTLPTTGASSVTVSLWPTSNIPVRTGVLTSGFHVAFRCRMRCFQPLVFSRMRRLEAKECWASSCRCTTCAVYVLRVGHWKNKEQISFRHILKTLSSIHFSGGARWILT